MTNETEKTNGNGNRATRRAAKAAPVKARTTRAKPGRSSTPAVEVKAKAKPYVNELGVLDELPAQATRAFKASDMKPIDSATADANIKTIHKSGNSTRRLAHVTACGILMHYATNGDWSKLTKLDSAIGEAFSRQMQRGFRQWVARFSTVQWRETKDSKGKVTFAGYVDSVKGEGMEAKRFNLTGDKTIDEKDSDRRIDREGALNNPFYSRNFGDTEPRDHVFDAVAEIKRLLARLEKEMALKRELLKAKKTRQARKIKLEESELEAVEKLAKSVFHIKLTPATATAGNA